MEEETLRYEFKLVCPAIHLNQARTWLRMHPAALRVAYPARRINNLYLDTLDWKALRANLAGIGERQKLRWRWYGEEWPFITPHLELKFKHGLLGGKKQIAPGITVDMSQPWKTVLAQLNAPLEGEWLATIRHFSHPALINAYWREYYVTATGAVRITLDFAQAAYDQRLGLRPTRTVSQLSENALIIEVKADAAHAQEAQAVVAALPLSRSRYSKYVGGMLAQG